MDTQHKCTSHFLGGVHHLLSVAGRDAVDGIVRAMRILTALNGGASASVRACQIALQTHACLTRHEIPELLAELRVSKANGMRALRNAERRLARSAKRLSASCAPVPAPALVPPSSDVIVLSCETDDGALGRVARASACVKSLRGRRKDFSASVPIAE